jgi:hypothetical protein
MPFFSNNYYYIIIGLQAICILHCLRKGRPNNWIWLIVFIPLVGSLIYIFSEIFTRNDVLNVQSGISSVMNPNGTVRRLEENLRFSDTFANRIALADAYLASDNTDKAIELYESSLTGNFEENEYVHSQLIVAYYKKNRYDDILPIAQKIYSLPQFANSRAHIFYAASLGYAGYFDKAEKEFKKMKGRYANYEARFCYGRFLIARGREPEARQVFSEILGETSHLTPQERRLNRNWFRFAKEELNKLNDRTVAR